MIFDLKSGKRRRVVQVVFGFLAFIFFISFVGFGIGSDVSGGIFDAIGIGGDDNNQDAESTYEQQIDDAQKKLDADPKNENALNDLARYQFLAGQENLAFDEETGVASLTDETRSEWDKALDSWEELLALKPDKLDITVASQMICAYVPPLPECTVQAPVDQINLDDAAATQKLLAEQEQTADTYAQLARLYYFDGNLEKGDQARDEALALADADVKKEYEKGFDQLRTQTEKFIQQQKEAEKAGGGEDAEPQLENPFGGLGSGDTALPPTGTP